MHIYNYSNRLPSRYIKLKSKELFYSIFKGVFFAQEGIGIIYLLFVVRISSFSQRVIETPTLRSFTLKLVKCCCLNLLIPQLFVSTIQMQRLVQTGNFHGALSSSGQYAWKILQWVCMCESHVVTSSKRK